MFCPNCGVDQKQPNQFCRTCGADLGTGMDALRRQDPVTAAAISAREEIGRAIAQKIREMSSSSDIKEMAEDVLPEIEKFLESPEQKRLRRIRTGTLISVIGFGVGLVFWLVAVIGQDPGFFSIAALGAICFFVGVAFILNGYLHTIGKDRPTENDGASRQVGGKTADLLNAQPASFESVRQMRSVTEGTTTHLDRKDPR